ncbi:MAG: hypothetical protein NTX79_04480 [Candidatus Micrarchaeota archaeon]|nr:hypothetical protein [Candidatus Micrarchaeota archaeon]
MVSFFGHIKNLWNKVDSKFGFVDNSGKIVFKPKTQMELLKFVRENKDSDLLKINLHGGRIRYMLEGLDAEYLFEEVKGNIQEKHIANKFKEANPKLFENKS